MINKPLVGKDGNHYKDYYEKRGADTRYDQHQALIEEQQKTNKLMKEQNERIKIRKIILKKGKRKISTKKFYMNGMQTDTCGCNTKCKSMNNNNNCVCGR